MTRLTSGGLIDRQRSFDFCFDGRLFTGYAGDTLASALLANDVRLVGRSFKYHRPRGVLTAGPEEPNALMELRTGARSEPNTRASTVELFDGLEAYSQNRWPSLAFDFAAVNSWFSPLLVAGFYYKTFMWPARWWEKVYEPFIRRAAGLGRASALPDPDTYEKTHAFCDVLVVGGGPGGLAAALCAGRAGARVILCEQDFVLGGRLQSDRYEVDGLDGASWADQAEGELRSFANVRVLRRTTVFGVYDQNTYGAVERVADHVLTPGPRQPRQCLWKIVAKRAILASGAIERPLVFVGNDRPGVMMASAVRTYLNRFAVACGSQTAVYTSTDDGWRTALDLVSAGLSVAAIVDTRPEVSRRVSAPSEAAGIPVWVGAQVVEAKGRLKLQAIQIRDSMGKKRSLRADVLAVSGGWNPTLALATHLGGRPVWNPALLAFVPKDPPPGMGVIGAANGSFRLADVLREGDSAGSEAAQFTGHHPASSRPRVTDDEPAGVSAFWYPAASTGKAFVDFQNDVTVGDIELASREGFRSIEHLKRYTTLGMGTDQGKLSNVNGLAILAQLTGESIPAMGTTTFRPPYAPVSLGALAGVHRGKQFSPARLTPTHEWAEEQGARFIESGQWLRAGWFPRQNEGDWLASVIREVKAVRSGVGVCDVSTLGKIDIQGADAGAFLDRIYTNMFSTLGVGRVRYGLMLREDGFVFDDGTSARFNDDHFVMSTTTANAGRVMQHLEYAGQVLWPDLDVQLTSVTEQWAQYAVAGPHSRRVLSHLFKGAIDLSDAAFPHQACAEFMWGGITTRLFRISFSGELAYEVAVPACYGDAVIRALMGAGEEWNVTPYGLEAMGVMRIEKGHSTGNEINGTTTAVDLGMGKLMSKTKDFIGRVLAGREGLTDVERPGLVGIRAVDCEARIHAGAHFIALGVPVSPKADEGYLTSVAYSPVLGRSIGLGFLVHGTQRVGERLRAFDPVRNSDVEVEVTAPVQFDPEGARLRPTEF